MMRKIVVETFESWQGEGSSMGRRCMFIRFGGCNLRCIDCDTKYSSDPQQFQIESWLTIEEVVERMKEAYERGIRRFIFTGGEPLLYQKEIVELIGVIDELWVEDLTNNRNQTDYPVFEFETNGTIKIKDELKGVLEHVNNIFNISPKSPHSQIKGFENKTKPEILEDIEELYLEEVVDDYIVKFVIWDERDKEFVKQIQQTYKIPSSKIYIQPNCIDGKKCVDKMRELLNWCKENNYNISPRLHLILGLK